MAAPLANSFMVRHMEARAIIGLPMLLTEGARLGPYVILSPLGAGGMGEVYRARDTRLDRHVALKVLPEQLSRDSALRQRFEREAKTLAGLSHPNICAVHDVGREGDVGFLVMEYLEGRTLAERLKSGPMTEDDALRTAAEMAAALWEAHRHGVVHRDLKPANVMLTRSGVKLLDFGLAKAMQAGASPETITEALTSQGQILGTFQYMAPEQLEGMEADQRSDIFAFGATLHEMLTGERAFHGATAASLSGSILHAEPKPLASPVIDRLVKSCLAKNPDERWQSARDLEVALRWIASGGVDHAPARARPSRLPWMIAAAAVALAVVAVVLSLRREAAPEAATVRFEIAATAGGAIGGGAPAISPDGHSVAFIATVEGRPLLCVRDLRSPESRSFAGTDGATYPFWSPDGRYIGFGAGGKVKKIERFTGEIQTICDAGNIRGATWNRDDLIVYAPTPIGPLWRVPANGGAPEPITKFNPGDNSHRWPRFLPGGRMFVYSVRNAKLELCGFRVRSLDGAIDKPLVSNIFTNAIVESDFLIYAREQTLLARKFDPSRLEPAGEPVVLDSRIGPANPINAARFDVSRDALVFGGAAGEVPSLAWFDRTGRSLGTIGPPGVYPQFMLSPDESLALVTQVDPRTGRSDLWTMDLRRGVLTRLTRATVGDFNPIWSPDGRRVAYLSSRGDFIGLITRPASGVGEEKILRKTGVGEIPQDWSPDGRHILFWTRNDASREDLWTVTPEGEARPYLNSEFSEIDGVFAPEGGWIAYSSDETGRYEVYVQSFPAGKGKQRVSTDGGRWPSWSRKGEIVFVAADRHLMAVPVKLGPTVEFGAPQRLFLTQEWWGTEIDNRIYAASADGRRILARAPSDAKAANLAIVLNWRNALNKR
jgi:Tol biopolymer transport system component/predicted Ser/Thr protein kinase